MSPTKIFGSPTWILNEPIFQFCQMKVADNNFGVLQAIKVHQVLQLYEQTNKGLYRAVIHTYLVNACGETL